MVTYVFNSPILTAYGRFSFEPVTVEGTKAVLQHGFVSAVGHEGTAQVLSKVLGLPIPVNRVATKMEKGDQAVVFRVLTRLPEGRVLTEEELEEVPYELGLLVKEEEI